MSFYCDRDVMQAGDTVILHLGKQSMLTICLKPGETYQTRYGCVRHDSLIGQPFGSRLKCAKGFLFAMKPTPELWTVNLPHRTQILYSTDISLVVLQLNLRPGSVVVESGTGSGSLSHALIRTIAPHGHLYTYEFHEQRAKTAEEEFKAHGLSDFVTVTHRDAVESGFTVDGMADAVFLDLPNPHSVIHHAKKALKSEGGRLCSFSPCIEQVQKTCLKLTELGFADLSTYECLLRVFDVRTCTIVKPPMGEVDRINYVNDSAVPGLLCEKDDSLIFKSAVAPAQQPGHTGYLTFATLYPSDTMSHVDEGTDMETAETENTESTE